MFSKACEYGIRACVVVAENSIDKKRISLKKIAKAINSPEAFTSKILQKLTKHNIIKSVQGAYGGFEIRPERLDELRLIDIIDTIDGNESYMGCFLGLKECSDNKPCPAHKRYKFIKDDLIQMMKDTTLVEMVNDKKKGFAYLKLEKYE
ncbi:MAG: Rrf2 family transcriptional regulator [Brumimicrobium sp.]